MASPPLIAVGPHAHAAIVKEVALLVPCSRPRQGSNGLQSLLWSRTRRCTAGHLVSAAGCTPSRTSNMLVRQQSPVWRALLHCKADSMDTAGSRSCALSMGWLCTRLLWQSAGQGLPGRHMMEQPLLLYATRLPLLTKSSCCVALKSASSSHPDITPS